MRIITFFVIFLIFSSLLTCTQDGLLKHWKENECIVSFFILPVDIFVFIQLLLIYLSLICFAIRIYFFNPDPICTQFSFNLCLPSAR